MLEIDEIVDPEITRGGVANDQRITVKSQRRLCSGEHAAEILVRLVEYLQNLLRHSWVRRGWLAIRRTPPQLVLGIVREILQLGKRFFETHVGVGEDAGKVGKTCGFSRLRGSIANMQHHARTDRNCRVLPVAFLRALLAGSDYHVGNVLGIGYIPLGEDADFGQRVEPRSISRLDR